MTLKMTRKSSPTVPRCTTEYRTQFRRDVGRARTAGLHQDHREARLEACWVYQGLQDSSSSAKANLAVVDGSLKVTRKLVYQHAVKSAQLALPTEPKLAFIIMIRCSDVTLAAPVPLAFIRITGTFNLADCTADSGGVRKETWDTDGAEGTALLGNATLLARPCVCTVVFARKRGTLTVLRELTLKMTRKSSPTVPRCTTEYRTQFRREVGRARTAGRHQDHRARMVTWKLVCQRAEAFHREGVTSAVPVTALSGRLPGPRRAFVSRIPGLARWVAHSDSHVLIKAFCLMLDSQDDQEIVSKRAEVYHRVQDSDVTLATPVPLACIRVTGTAVDWPDPSAGSQLVKPHASSFSGLQNIAFREAPESSA
ncbi:unnamed protein product [Arctogadus glacialis]